MTRFRLIAIDMDGTLLNSRKEISEKDLSAVQAAADAGLMPVFCTGRAVPETEMYFPLLPAVRCGVFGCGACVWDFREKRLLGSAPMLPEAVKAIADAEVETDCFCLLHTPDTVFMREGIPERLERYGIPELKDLYRRYGTPVSGFAEVLHAHMNEIVKADLIFSREKQCTAAMERLMPEALTVCRTGPTALEINAAGVSKATGLETLCAALGISMENAVMCGDSMNDLEAIRRAGLGAAMGNADPAVKAAAGISVSDCDHSGVSEIIARCLSEGGAYAENH